MAINVDLIFVPSIELDLLILISLSLIFAFFCKSTFKK